MCGEWAVKCCDLFPGAVVLALALELGKDPGTCCALRPCTSSAPSGLQGRRGPGLLVVGHQRHPSGLIPVNVLTTIFKWEVDSLHREVCARTAALPPVPDEEAAAALEAGDPLSLKDAGPGYAALGSLGYADDTRAVAPGAAALEGTVPATEEWLRITGHGMQRSRAWCGTPPILGVVNMVGTRNFTCYMGAL